MKRLHVYLPDHVRQALSGKGKLTEEVAAVLEAAADG